VLAAMHEHLTKAAVAGDGTEEELDVRSLPHASRHERIFACLGDLKVDQSLVIANDHDPKPLYYQLEALWPGAYDWSYLDRGPQIWRVRVRRQEAAA
ncbi:MAG: DUF2249 domain-containing protein, partial [Acidimicrobiales bacterium]